MLAPIQAVLAPLLVLAAACAQAEPPLAEGETGEVASVEDALVLTLADGLVVRLAGVAAPEDAEARGDSRNALAALAEGRTATLRYGGARRDRRGRAVAHLFLEGEPETWAQGRLTAEGWLAADSIAEDAAMARELQALEAAAREAGLGHWATGAFAVRGPEPDALAQHLDSFQIVEGVVVEAAAVRGWTYLNFGLDYRTDFTVAVPPDAADRFQSAGLDPLELAGARIRARGWLEARNGPMITADHPEQIEALD